MRTLMRTFVSLPVALALSLAACGSTERPPGLQGNRIGTTAIPTGADEVVFRIDSRGGFTSAEYQLAIVPQLSVYGDGRVIMTGPVTEIYPGQALPNLLTGTLERAEIIRLARRAVDLDLLAPLDFGQPGVTDMPTTTVTINVDGSHEQSAYALDFTEANQSLTGAQRDARDRLSTFTRALGDAAAKVATDPFTAAEAAIYARRATDADDSGGVEPNRVDWPLGDLATIGTPSPDGAGIDAMYRCAVLTGAEAATALDAARDATTITRWRSGGAEFTIVWRPLLPDEHACP